LFLGTTTVYLSVEKKGGMGENALERGLSFLGEETLAGGAIVFSGGTLLG